MIEQHNIILRQRRNFGETLNATFVFVRRYWRVLLQSLVQLILPALVIIAGLIVILLQTYVIGVDTGSADSSGAIVVTVLVVLVCILLFSAAFAIASAVYYAIVRLALQRGDDFTVANVRAVVRQTVMSLVGMYIFQGILSSIVSYIFMIPMTFFIRVGNVDDILELEAIIVLLSVGSQFAFVTYASCSYAVLVVEGRGIYNSIQRSFKLVRGNFWPTLGLVIVVSIIVYLMMLAPVVHPILIATILYGIFDPVAMSRWVASTSIVVEVVGAVYGLFVAMSFFFVWMFPTTAIALHYISLVERKEGVGLAIRIHRNLPQAPDEPVETARTAGADSIPDSEISSASVDETNDHPNSSDEAASEDISARDVQAASDIQDEAANPDSLSDDLGDRAS